MATQHTEGPPRFTSVSWVLLDWAASAFSTVLITLVVAYVERIACADRPWGLDPGVVWAWTLAASMLVSAIMAPGFSAWADRRQRHQEALVTSVAVGAGSLFVLAGVGPAVTAGVLGAVALANIGFDMATIFSGSLLSTMASGRLADRLSAFGFAAGYAGGAIALVLATMFVSGHEGLGLTLAGGLRAAFVFTGAWWLLFSMPAAFARFHEDFHARHSSSSLGELWSFARSLVRPDVAQKHVAAVLVGSMLVLGAVQTAIAQFSSLAIADLHLEPAALVRLILLVQVIALPGALFIGWLSERAGRRTAISLCLAGWSLVLVLAWFVETATQLHALAVLLALVLGGVQSAVRAAVADAAPAGRGGVTFGVLQVGIKLAGATVGLVFGLLQLASGLSRAGLAALLIQLVAGWWILGWMENQPRSSDSENITH